MPRVFLVTGCTSGFGANLVQEIIDKVCTHPRNPLDVRDTDDIQGDICVASARNTDKLKGQFKNTTEKVCLLSWSTVFVDLTMLLELSRCNTRCNERWSNRGCLRSDPKTIWSRWCSRQQRWVCFTLHCQYTIEVQVADIICNSYGLSGPFEEVTLEQGRTQFDINFFGLTQVTRKALSVMRDQSPCGGLIQQVTSVGGQIGVPSFSFYCATKWAVEGFSETVSKELKPEWNIDIMCVEPGGFRTEWSGNSMKFPEKRHPGRFPVSILQLLQH